MSDNKTPFILLGHGLVRKTKNSFTYQFTINKELPHQGYIECVVATINKVWEEEHITKISFFSLIKSKIKKKLSMFQLCPVCKGAGVTPPSYPYVSSETMVECNTCKGKKIISQITGLPPAWEKQE